MVLTHFRRLSLSALLAFVFWSVIGNPGGQTVSARQQPAIPQDDQDDRGNPVDLKLAQATAIGDFNGDGITDVAVADFFHDVVNVMVRGNDGRFARAASVATGRGPRSIVAGDFNHDGVLDLAVASFLSGDVRILLGDGAARFHESGVLQLTPGISSLSSGLVVANFLSGEVSKVRVDAAGTVEGVEPIGEAPGTALLLSRDVDGDGLDDVIAIDAAGNDVRLFGATASGRFEDRGRVDAAAALAGVRDARADGASLRTVSGDGQTALSGSRLPETFVVEVRDALADDTLPQVPVVFSSLAGVENVASSTQRTDDDGLAELQLTAASAPQNQFVAAAVASANAVVAGSLTASSDSAFRAALHASPTGNQALDTPAARLAIDAALDAIAAGADVDGLATLTTMINSAAAAGPVSDVLRQVVNQVLTIGPAAGGADLVETAVSEPPAIVTVKDKFVASDTVSNQGASSAGPSTTRYYLSVDGVQKTKLLGGGGRNVPGLGAGASSAGSDTVAVSASMKPGFYFLVACADDRTAVLEDNETNNCRSSIGQVQVKAPDLIVTALSEPPASGTEGSSITVSDTTKNNGDLAAGNSTTSYYLSLDQKKSNNDVLVANRVVGTLAPGASSSGSVSATLSAPPNAYYLIACADALKKVPESNTAKKGEKNNCLTSTGKITVLPGGADGGPTDNGAMVTGRISAAGEVDEWTFTATAGDRITGHIGEIADDNDFRPRLRLLSPSDSVLADASGVSATVFDDVVAPATGTYKVRVSSFDSGFDGTGSYRLSIVHTPPPITVSAGDQGGPLTNGAIHTGEILQGDVDVWTFTANAGDRIAVHVGEIADTDDFRPWIRVWAPNGATLGDVGAGVDATVDRRRRRARHGHVSRARRELRQRLRRRRHLPPHDDAHAGADHGVAGRSGRAAHQSARSTTGEITQGDVDVWTFTATAGDRIALHIGEIADTDDFRPWLRLWAPNGATLGDVSGVCRDGHRRRRRARDWHVHGARRELRQRVRRRRHVPADDDAHAGAHHRVAWRSGRAADERRDSRPARSSRAMWTSGRSPRTPASASPCTSARSTDTDDFRPWMRLWAQNGADPRRRVRPVRDSAR